MRELVEKIEAIELKVRDLADKYARLKAEHVSLKEENRVLNKDLDRLKEEKNQLEVQLSTAIAEASAGKKSEKERVKLKKELGQYIKEIDKCILMMGEL